MNYFDFFIVFLSVAALLLIAYFKGKDEKDTNDFFLGRRKIPVWAACFSFVATEISAMTIVGVPAVGFNENWQYLQFFMGSAIARVFIAYFFIPVFYKFNCTTIYEFLKYRFGSATRYSGSVFFFITRLLASGVRLYAASLAVSVIMGWDLKGTLLFFTAISVVFIAFGGIKAVIWTGVFEAASFYAAGFIVLVYAASLAGGFGEVWKIAGEAGKLSVFNFNFSMDDPNVWWLAVMNGVFGSMASFGTDQELMQRLLTLETRESSRKTMLATILAAFPVVLIYLGVGTALFVFYEKNPSLVLPENSDKILSHFALNVLPNGLKGVILAAVVLASIDSPLSSLSSSFVTDIYRPLVSKVRSEKHYLLVSRISVVFFGLLLAAVAYACKFSEGMLWLAFKINGVTAGSLLGVFLLGLFTKRKADKSNVCVMTGVAVSMGALLYMSETRIIDLGWSWLIIIGTAATFAGGWILGKPRR